MLKNHTTGLIVVKDVKVEQLPPSISMIDHHHVETTNQVNKDAGISMIPTIANGEEMRVS